MRLCVLTAQLEMEKDKNRKDLLVYQASSSGDSVVLTDSIHKVVFYRAIRSFVYCENVYTEYRNYLKIKNHCNDNA